MIDISRTIITVTISAIFYCIFILYAWVNYNFYCTRTGFYISRSISKTTIFCCFMVALLPFFAPDFEGHQMVLSITKTYGAAKSHVEPVYNYLMEIVEYDYFSFRLVIIGVGFLLLMKIIDKYSIDKNICWITIIIFFIYPMANIMRSSFADIICLFGILSYYRRPYLKNLIICLLFSAIALFFHKSTFMIIVPFVLSLKVLKKSVLKVFFVSLPIIIIIGRIIISSLINIYFADNSFVTEGDFILSKRILSYFSNGINIILFTYIILKGKYLLPDSTLYGYMYRLFLYSYMIWICLLCMGVSHYVPARFISHMYIIIAFLVSFLTVKLKRKKVLFSMVTLYVFNVLFTSVMTLRDCYLQILSADILNLK